MTSYLNPSSNQNIQAENLSSLPLEEQLETLEYWFRSKYEDPAERTPYETAEGGYQWIWGGPFETREVLEDQFSSVIDQSVIDTMISRLEHECYYWGPTPSEDDYDAQLIEDIASIGNCYINFGSSLIDINQLLEIPVSNIIQNTFYRLIYANVITVLETYLSDAFITEIFNNSDKFRKFIESTEEFKKTKITISEIFNESDRIEVTARKYLSNIVWHRLEKVSYLYKNTLNIAFSEEKQDILKAIQKRHDIIHRNGFDENGNEIIITLSEINTLILKTTTFISRIDMAL